MQLKIDIPDSLAEKMALFSEADFRKLMMESIEKYVNENEPRVTFEQKVARSALKTWRERI